jgi:hypothetical protein
MVAVRSRFVLLGLFLLARVAFGAAGEFQQTRDDKTTVWNGNPKPGETASWVGSRDKEGYAHGFGTIRWYTAQGTVYATYYGNMVHGKLEGPVNAHSRGKTAHAYFAEGGRVTAWARGPAPSHPEPNWPLRARPVENPKTDEIERRTEVATEPKPKKPQPEPKRIRPIEHAAQKPEEKEQPPPGETPTPQKSTELENRETIEHPVEETPKQSSGVAETTTIPTPEPRQSESSIVESPKIAESQETPKPLASEPPQVPTPEPSVEQKPETERQPATTESPRKSGVDGSLSALTGPPSTLRSSSMSESPAPTKTTSRSSGTRGVAQLNEDEAIGLADIEARSRGYDLNEYQRPKSDYSAVKDKWTLFYNLKDAKMAGGDLQPFSVTVEDKTKKVEIRRNF